MRAFPHAAPRAGLAAILHVLRMLGLAALIVLAVGGIPGASLQPILQDLVAPPVPADVKDRDGALDVVVHDGAGGPPLAGAHVRALALVDDRAYLADARDTDAAGTAHLTKLPHGDTWLLAEAPGKARASTHLVVEAGLRAVSMDLMPEHAIEVAVKDE
ncbi:MAG TPA: carboxypeptidase-like regulatory domain-containing protein, partial [Polyangiaceae bacterium]